MENSSHRGAQRPYQTLGTQLKTVREQHNESLAEVCGAVEIDLETLERIEDGHERPSEDILMLLINHFNVQDQEAVRLWESAGYEGDDGGAKRPLENLIDKGAVVILATDVRTMYSDGLTVDANNGGMVLSFTQGGMAKSSQNVVARVGMSYEQAQQVVTTLQQAILYGRFNPNQRQLPPSTKH